MRQNVMIDRDVVESESDRRLCVFFTIQTRMLGIARENVSACRSVKGVNSRCVIEGGERTSPSLWKNSSYLLGPT